MLITNSWSDFYCVCVCSQSLSRVRLFVAPGTVACQAPLFIEFSRQEYWSGLPFPPAGNLPYPGIKRPSLASPILTGRFLTTAPPRKPAFNFLYKMALKIHVLLTSDSMLCPQRIMAESLLGMRDTSPCDQIKKNEKCPQSSQNAYALLASCISKEQTDNRTISYVS